MKIFERRSSFWKAAAAAVQSRTSWWVTLKMGWRANLCEEGIIWWTVETGMSGPGLDQEWREKYVPPSLSQERWKAIRVDWCATVFAMCFFHFVLLSSSGSSWIHLTPFESEDSSDLVSETLFQQQTACVNFYPFVFLLCSMYCTLSSTACTCKPCRQSKPHQL